MRFLLAILVSVALVFSIDLITGAYWHTSTQMSVVRTKSGINPSHTLIVFPGFAGDCQSISDAFGPHLMPDWQMVVLCYPDRDIDDAQVFDLLRPVVEAAPRGSVSILAGSMGAMVSVKFLDSLARSSPGFRPDLRLILDDSPADQSLVRMSWILPLSTWYRGGVLSSAIWYALHGSRDHSSMESGASLDVVERGDLYFQEIGIPALASQGFYIYDFRLDDHSEFKNLLRSATFVKAGGGGQDPLVDVDASIAAWAARLPQLRVVTLVSRHGDWHVPWTSRPREILTVVLAAN